MSKYKISPDFTFVYWKVIENKTWKVVLTDLDFCAFVEYQNAKYFLGVRDGINYLFDLDWKKVILKNFATLGKGNNKLLKAFFKDENNRIDEKNQQILNIKNNTVVDWKYAFLNIWKKYLTYQTDTEHVIMDIEWNELFRKNLNSYKYVVVFADDYFLAFDKSKDKRVIFDNKGDIVVEITDLYYSSKQPYIYNHVFIAIDEKEQYFLYNLKEKKVIAWPFTWIEEMDTDWICRFTNHWTEWFINTDGKIIYEVSTASASIRRSFKNGVAFIHTFKGYHAIDKQGNILFKDIDIVNDWDKVSFYIGDNEYTVNEDWTIFYVFVL